MINDLASKLAEEIVGAEPLDESAVLPPCAAGKILFQENFVQV
jgi:hypothetical protein